MSRGRSAVASVALLLAAAPLAAQTDAVVPVRVQNELAGLRLRWPEVATAEMRSGRRFEFRDGKILLGSDRLAELVAEDAENHGAVLNFLLAHEAWHSVQAQRRTAAEIQQMKSNRMLECEADFMGAAAAYRGLQAQGLSQDDIRKARRAIEKYIVGLPPAPLFAGAAYPINDLRATTVSIGWGQARDPSFLSSSTPGAPLPAAEVGRAAAVCRTIAKAGDSSVGNLQVQWLPTPPGPAGNLTLYNTMVVRNLSARPIVFTILVPSVRQIGPSNATYSVDDWEMSGAMLITRQIDAGGSIVAPTQVGTGAPGVMTFASTAPHVGGMPLIPIMSRYADAGGPIDYCFSHAAQAAVSADRALLARLGAIAISAGDDFRAVSSGESYDNAAGRQVLVNPAFAFSPIDSIWTGGGQSYATITPFQSTDEGAVRAEYARLVNLFRQLCGSDIVAAPPEGELALIGEEESVEIRRLAPKAAVRLKLMLWPKFYANQPGQIPEQFRSRGGQIVVYIQRNPGL